MVHIFVIYLAVKTLLHYYKYSIITKYGVKGFLSGNDVSMTPKLCSFWSVHMQKESYSTWP
jgi:hypothetical protein